MINTEKPPPQELLLELEISLLRFCKDYINSISTVNLQEIRFTKTNDHTHISYLHHPHHKHLYHLLTSAEVRNPHPN